MATCPRCDGRGGFDVPCDICNGTRIDRRHGLTPTECNSCFVDGTQYVFCPICNGSGELSDAEAERERTNLRQSNLRYEEARKGIREEERERSQNALKAAQSHATQRRQLNVTSGSTQTARGVAITAGKARFKPNAGFILFVVAILAAGIIALLVRYGGFSPFPAPAAAHHNALKRPVLSDAEFEARSRRLSLEGELKLERDQLTSARMWTSKFTEMVKNPRASARTRAAWKANIAHYVKDMHEHESKIAEIQKALASLPPKP